VQAPTITNEDNLPLVFERVLVIVGGGEVDIGLLAGLHARGDAIIAADGGAEHCAQAGIVPEAIIGDMDSLVDKKKWIGKTRLIEIPEQETTDFEKCLYSTKAKVAIVLGVIGGRLDHTLAATDVLARYGRQRDIIMMGEEDLVVVVAGDFRFEVEPGARVSIHPLGQVTFACSKGLQYPLDGVELAPGLRTGTSNKAVAGSFEIIPRTDNQAPYLVIMDKKYLGNLVQKLAAGHQTP
jgi:thiamine pyrophosphokinase